MGDEQTTSSCESCGGYVHEGRDDGFCHGCKTVICQSCADVFDHIGDGMHGEGNPREEVRNLRAQIADGPHDFLGRLAAKDKELAQLRKINIAMGTTIRVLQHVNEQELRKLRNVAYKAGLYPFDLADSATGEGG